MKKVLLGLLFAATPAWADTDGVNILPFTTPGGAISGTVAVYPDGTAEVSGWVQGCPFSSWGHASKGSDGKWHFKPLLSDGDYLKRHKSFVPVSMSFWGTQDDASDGDSGDDSVGEITVESQIGVGKGSVQLSG